MTEVGESVAVGTPEESSEPDQSHPELELEITDIVDAAGTSIMNGANDYDPRQNAVVGDQRTVITYEVRNHPTFVFVSIKPDPGSQIAQRYYRRSNIISFCDIVSPGSHTIEWDGRGVIDRRFIIEGDYIVTVDGFCPHCITHVEHTANFHVRKPWAHCFGGIYGGTGALVGSTLHGNYTARANSAKTRLENLSDGSGFESQSFSTETGASALVKMHEESAVWFWGGHGGPGIISLPAGGTMTAIISQASVAATYSAIVTAANCSDVSALPDHALEDVFMIVLCGCQTSATPAGGTSLPQALVDKGADIVIGFNQSIYTDSANQWTDDFFRFLGLSIGVEDAIRRANARAATAQYRQRLNSYRIFVSPGGGRNAKLNPARYGKKVS
ncbi:MAG: hypothetical protein ABFD82_17140 [Syntrophaceae bacterium]